MSAFTMSALRLVLTVARTARDNTTHAITNSAFTAVQVRAQRMDGARARASVAGVLHLPAQRAAWRDGRIGPAVRHNPLEFNLQQTVDISLTIKLMHIGDFTSDVAFLRIFYCFQIPREFIQPF